MLISDAHYDSSYNLIFTRDWRASICWERPLKFPGQLSNCWRLTSSPTSLIKTYNSRSSSNFRIQKSLMINHMNMWYSSWAVRLGRGKKIPPSELLSTPAWRIEPDCDTQSLSAGQQLIFPAVISPLDFPAFVNKWYVIQSELQSFKVGRLRNILLVNFHINNYLTIFRWPLILWLCIDLLARWRVHQSVLQL